MILVLNGLDSYGFPTEKSNPAKFKKSFIFNQTLTLSNLQLVRIIELSFLNL